MSASVLPANCGKIIFVTGASRSGTTLVCRIIGNNSKVLALNEMHYFGALQSLDTIEESLGAESLVARCAMMLAKQRDFWVDKPTGYEKTQARQIVAELPERLRTGAGLYAATVAWLANTAGKIEACEQTPRNIFYAERLLEIYPEARFVHIVRDPRAVLASQKNRWQVRKLGAKDVPVSEVIRLWLNYHPVTMTRLWSSATQVALGLENHPRFTLVKFEDLVADPNQVVGELCDWLGLDFQEAMLDVPQWGSSNVRHEGGQGVSSVMKDQWKEALSGAEVSISEKLTAPLLAHFGYSPYGDSGLSPGVLIWLVLRYPIHIIGAVLTNPRRVMIQLRALLRARKGASA